MSGCTLPILGLLNIVFHIQAAIEAVGLFSMRIPRNKVKKKKKVVSLGKDIRVAAVASVDPDTEKPYIHFYDLFDSQTIDEVFHAMRVMVSVCGTDSGIAECVVRFNGRTAQ